MHDIIDNRPTVSILIAAHNEAANVDACLRSVLACSGPDGFEVVVVDDGSSDDTAGIVKRIASSDARVRLVSQVRGGKGRALNLAIRNARGATCLVTDADCRVPASSLSGMTSELECADLVYGTFRLWDGPADGGLWLKIQESKQRVKWSPWAPEVFSPVGASMAFKRVAWQDIGGSAENGTGTDRDFGERALRRGWVVSCSIADHSRVLTEGSSTYSGFLRQALRWRNVRAFRNLLTGSWQGSEQVLALSYASGVSLVFLLWTVWCMVTGNWVGLGLGVAGVVGVDLVAYSRALLRMASRSETRMWTVYFLGWVLCMVPVRLCEIPYLLTRLVRGVAPVWETVR
ncbi:MAG: glycosyltransferase [Lentisphaeria bacterium]|nr:glycosyltransferase [Lentisphaeria bacterium]